MDDTVGEHGHHERLDVVRDDRSALCCTVAIPRADRHHEPSDRNEKYREGRYDDKEEIRDFREEFLNVSRAAFVRLRRRRKLGRIEVERGFTEVRTGWSSCADGTGSHAAGFSPCFIVSLIFLHRFINPSKILCHHWGFA